MAEPPGFDPGFKREFDLVLRENQQLHAELQALERPAGLFRAIARLGRRELRRRPSAPRRRRAAAPAAMEPDPNFAQSFRPYEVRPRLPATDTRPLVLHAIGNFYTGGSPRLVIDLVEGLSDRFAHVTIVRDSPLRPHYTGLDLRVVHTLRTKRDALALLRELQPQLIHIHFLGHHRHAYSEADWRWYDHLFRAAAEYGAPVIENVNIPVAPYFSSAVTRYVFVSDYVRAIFGAVDAPNVTIHPGSDFTRFSRPAEAVPPEGCIGMVYRLEKDKLDEATIQIFIEVLRRRPLTKAVIVGGGRYLEAYRTAVQEAGLIDAVTFTAYVAYEQLPRLYEQMSIFIAPPHWESFGHVVPLAMNMAIPVAAYAVGALPEILGDNGVFAPAGDSVGLAAKVVELIDDRERSLRIGAANRARAQRLFSVERMLDSYRALYEESLVSSATVDPRVP